MDTTFSEINIKEFTLDDFSVSKLAAPTVEIVFHGKIQNAFPDSPMHGQLKCSNLIYPFIKENFEPVALPIRHASTLVNSDSAAGIKEVIEIELDSTPISTFHHYSPGDTIAILPQNDEKDVTFLLIALNLNDRADEACQLQMISFNPKKTTKFPYIPLITTPRELLRDILNIRTILKKQCLRALANCCLDKDEQNFLNCLASKDGSHYYDELLLERRLTLIDILHLCSSCKPTLALFIEHLPRLLPRPYSIANSPLDYADKIKILFSILNERPGVTTSMLSNLVCQNVKQDKVKIAALPKVLAYPRQVNNFRYTNDDFEQNQVLIGIGTGIAPFLGFLEHKRHLIKNSTNKPGRTWLFVGGTVETAIPHRIDILELIDKYGSQVIERYLESLSRVPDAMYHYVQDLITAHAKALVEFLLLNETTLYVCADGARISRDIETNLCLAFQQELNIAADEAKEMLKQFRANGKYREDLWL